MSTLEMKERLQSFVDESSEEIIAESYIVAYNKEIDKAMKEIDKGNFFTHEEVKERVKKRYESSKN